MWVCVRACMRLRICVCACVCVVSAVVVFAFLGGMLPRWQIVFAALLLLLVTGAIGLYLLMHFVEMRPAANTLAGLLCLDSASVSVWYNIELCAVQLLDPSHWSKVEQQKTTKVASQNIRCTVPIYLGVHQKICLHYPSLQRAPWRRPFLHANTLGHHVCGVCGAI